jgi:hypothetical protein
MRYLFLIFGVDLIGVYRRPSRSNVRLPGVSRTINHEELAEVIGTGSIGGSKAVSRDS